MFLYDNRKFTLIYITEVFKKDNKACAYATSKQTHQKLCEILILTKLFETKIAIHISPLS